MPESLLDDRSIHSQQESDFCGTCVALCCGCCCCFSLFQSNMWCIFRSCSGRRVPAEGEQDDAASITYPDEPVKKSAKPAVEQPAPQPSMTPA
ncbi:hypothetical protein VTO73DRAFT_4947 [Trametes versicolor]